MANGTTLPWAVSPFSWFRCPRAGLPGLAGTSNDGLVVAVCRGNLPSQIVVMEPCALAVALAAWFVAFLIIWMASPDRWLTDHLFGWLPWQLRQLSSVAGGGLAGMEFVALMILAFVGNGFAGPVTEKLYFRGHLLSGSLGATGMERRSSVPACSPSITCGRHGGGPRSWWDSCPSHGRSAVGGVCTWARLHTC